MSYIGDEDWQHPFCTHQAEQKEASRHFERVIDNVKLMLATSASTATIGIQYPVWQGEIT